MIAHLPLPYFAPLETVQLLTAAGPAITDRNILLAVNFARTAAGQPALEESKALDAVAAAKLADMKAKNYFDHTSPTGEQFWDFYTALAYPYHHAGENLAISYTSTQDVVAAWVASPDHYANIIDPKYVKTGIATDGNLVVQEFANE